MDYAYTFTGGFRPSDPATFEKQKTTIAGMAFIMLGRMAALKGDQPDASTFSCEIVDNGDLIFRMAPKLDAEGLCPSQRRLELEKVEARRLRDEAMAAMRAAQ